jgi:hypothetical protein
MKSVNNKIIVSCDASQKDSAIIAGSVFSFALKYEVNYRLRSPTIATVVEGNNFVRKGDVLLCHHNLFYLPSPYHIYENLFSVPYSKVLFAKVLEDGSLLPICGNILGDKVDIETPLPVPPDQRKQYDDRMVVTDAGYTKYKIGDMLFTRPSATYEIIYNWDNQRRSAIKISEDMVCGILR